MSFIYKRNSNGPSVDPWGTPHMISTVSDEIPFTSVYCVRFERYDLTKSNDVPRIP